MALNFFDQFMTPMLVGIPLITIATMMPALIISAPTSQWMTSRIMTLQSQVITNSTYQLFVPLSPKSHTWALLIISLMTFLIIINLLGLLPYTFTPTTQLSFNMAFAVPAWLATVIIGLRTQPTHAFAHLLPESTPPMLIPVLIIIETISLFIRPLALGVRLTANLTAGHLLIQLISTAVFTLMYSMPVIGVLTGTLLVLLSILEIAVAMIQAYVFVLLLSLYLQENS
uniref:ATP synthase subunit a n=1 Tax=Cynoglossus nanhaiensis TaxID=2213132 RepID=A0A7L7S277_9PLEU|nr:ATP synthase F0 subunit 6 [Cynoglossus nanhaiensis]AWQ65112.1 ATP synthase subunit-6 [Cynoglossus nanhaiensis]QNV46918.1 ATP synthase F0 subunit 6 [Cynoglossus nanhaiensis]